MIIQNLLKNGNLIKYLIYITYLLYLILYLKLFLLDSYYINTIELITQFYITITILIYFNPFSSFKELTPNMKRLIFSSGLILLTNNIGRFILFLKKGTNSIYTKTKDLL